MKAETFRAYAHQAVDWMADYYQQIEQYPVKSQVKPGEILEQIPKHMPESGESMDEILKDFNEVIMPGITHWQHPNYHSYFPANTSFPSLLGEMLTAALGAQCMIWDTSPAAAELEEAMMNWLKEVMQLPSEWEGSIQSTASDATLNAILSAREKKTDFQINKNGFQGNEKFRVYCSSQTHSSIEKGAKIAGIGSANTVKVGVDESFAMKPDLLRKAIQEDIENGLTPLIVIAATGTTGSTAMDPLTELGEICQEFGIWFHVDAAYAGTAFLLPEFRDTQQGVELADSFVFNPHKWMFTNFDCTAYFVKDKGTLIRTFEILPEYLKTQFDQTVNNYRDWGIPLGRRFRALKLWFVMRNMGLSGMQEILRGHMTLTQDLVKKLEAHPDFEILAPVPLNLVCFRYKPTGMDEAQLNELNAQLVKSMNDGGEVYLTHTKLDGKYTLRVVIGQTYVQQKHVDKLWEILLSHTSTLTPAL
ncbi:MAG: aminotransferase class I/II-fold pyridoxal phosphate-dependent enzyme [Bacteroidota bacterium]